MCCLYEDDPSIPDDEVLYRRLPEHHLKTMEGSDLGYRMTSNAFHDPDPKGISVYVKSILYRLGLTAEDVLPEKPGLWGVAGTTAGAVRRQGFGVRLRPDPDVQDDERNAAHAELTGLLLGKAGGRQAKNLTKEPAKLLLVKG